MVSQKVSSVLVQISYPVPIRFGLNFLSCYSQWYYFKTIWMSEGKKCLETMDWTGKEVKRKLQIIWSIYIKLRYSDFVPGRHFKWRLNSPLASLRKIVGTTHSKQKEYVKTFLFAECPFRNIVNSSYRKRECPKSRTIPRRRRLCSFEP